MTTINIWPVHFADDIPRWRVVTFQDSVIVAERQFHNEEEAYEYYNTLAGMNGAD